MKSTWLSISLLLVTSACGKPPEPSAPSASDAPTTPAPDVTPVGVGAPPKLVTTVEGISAYELGNGLRVLLFPDPSKTTLTVNATYLVGSRHEGYGETGMAHLLEHMMFKGTPTSGDPWKQLEQRGARFNGTTDYDRTNYYETLPATDDNLDFALGLEADRMVHSKIAAEDLQTEFTVVRNEFEMGENRPEGILLERMLSTAFLWHNYGKSPIGSRSDIERVPVPNLRAFYEKYYQPDNAVLIVAGKIDPAATLDKIDKTFGAIPRPTRTLGASYTVEPVQDGERLVTLRRAGDVQLVGVAYHVVAGSDPDFVAVEAAAHLLTAEPSGRLYQALVQTGKATAVFAMAQPLAEPGTLLIGAQVLADKSLDEVRDIIVAEVEGLAKKPASDEEVARFKAAQAKSFELTMTDPQEVAINLSEWQALGDWRLLFVHRDRVAALEAAAVTDVAARYLKSANRTEGRFLPTKAPDRSPLPERPDVAKAVDGYQGQAAKADGEAFEASIANIEARTTRSEIGGIKVALLPKTTKGGAVRAKLVLHFGDPGALAGKGVATTILLDMFMRGTAHHSFQQIKDELDRLKASVTFSAGRLLPRPGMLAVNIETTKDNLVPVLALVQEMLREPSLAADQFEIAKKELLTTVTTRLTDPQFVAFTTALKKLLPYPADDARYIPSIDEAVKRVEAVTVDDVKRVYADFLGASNGELAIVGDFAVEPVTAAITELASWKSPRPYTRVQWDYIATEPGAVWLDTPDKESGFLIAIEALELRDDNPDWPALELSNWIFGGAPSSRLMARLRQKEGWSYGAFSGIQASPVDTWGFFFAGALAAPQNADKAMGGIMEELGRLLSEGISDAELADAKQGMRSAFETTLADDDWVVGALADGLEVGRTLSFDQRNQDAMQALTTADVKRVLAAGHIKKEGLASVIAADKAKAAAP